MRVTDMTTEVHALTLVREIESLSAATVLDSAWCSAPSRPAVPHLPPRRGATMPDRDWGARRVTNPDTNERRAR